MKLSIRYKLIIGYVLICVFSLGILNVVLSKAMKVNNRKIISNELRILQEKTQGYTENFYNTNLRSTPLSQDDFLNNLRFSLSRYYNEYMIIYDTDRNKISEFNPDINVDELVGKSMDNIEENISSYDINYIEDKVIVDFPVKIRINDKDIGVVRYFIDYTNLIIMEKTVSSIVFYFSLILGILMVILSIINSNTIVNSILKFKEFVGKIGENNSDELLEITSEDEIGQLANNINMMKQRITSQIEEIKKDKEEIEEISNYRKHFYDNVTHELKTPLTTIIGYTELSIYEKSYNEENLNLINEECNRMYNLVTSLLDISYYGRNDIYKRMEKLNVNELIDDVCEKMAIKATKLDIDLCIKRNEFLELYGDREGIKTILINLIDNSIKYNKEYGNIEISSFVEKDQWILIVEDSGLGISEESKLNLFKPFYRSLTSQTHNLNSSGLGLSIVKEIVDFHKGIIEVDSNLGIGTKITIKIPL